MLGARTLRYYVGRRFVMSIAAAFIVCAALIFMIDMIELLRLSRRATDLSIGALFWMALLRLPAFSEILLSFAVMVGSIVALLTLNRKSELTVMRAGGSSGGQFLRPGITSSGLVGVLAFTIDNPPARGRGPRPDRPGARASGRAAVV